jgi:DNA-directed RNA polymerase subunit H (RpoH/RPB5)
MLFKHAVNPVILFDTIEKFMRDNLHWCNVLVEGEVKQEFLPQITTNDVVITIRPVENYKLVIMFTYKSKYSDDTNVPLEYLLTGYEDQALKKRVASLVEYLLSSITPDAMVRVGILREFRQLSGLNIFED